MSKMDDILNINLISIYPEESLEYLGNWEKVIVRLEVVTPNEY